MRLRRIPVRQAMFNRFRALPKTADRALGRGAVQARQPVVIDEIDSDGHPFSDFP
jgi:hypothetical protein